MLYRDFTTRTTIVHPYSIDCNSYVGSGKIARRVARRGAAYNRNVNVE